MKTPYKNIYAVLKLNRLVVYTVVFCNLLMGSYAVWTVFRVHKQAQDKAFAVNTDGTVIPLAYKDQKDNLEVEALAHLKLFHTYFYDLNAGTYKDNLDKALWLANSSVDDLYKQKKTDGLYNRLLQYGLVQQVTGIESTLTEENGTYSFETQTEFEIKRGSTVDTYRQKTTGKLMSVARNFPHNPHGLLITDFYEATLQKIND